MLTLTYTSTQLLNCGPCRPEVIVCVRPELMLNGAPYIDGKLVGTTHSRTSSGQDVYTYRIDYDETLLAPPTVRLNACDVKGVVCRGCLTDYVDFQTSISGETPNTGVDTLSINTTASGVLGRDISADLIVSVSPGNALSILPDGVYVAPSGADTPNTATDSSSINITLTGLLGRDIQADVIISPSAGNLLSILPTGLFAGGFTTTPICPSAYFVGSSI